MQLNRHKVLILSGGKSRRYGSPKALAKYNGETFLDIILSKCLSLDLEIYVVLNPEVDALIKVDRAFTTILLKSTKDMYDSISKGISEIGDFSQLMIWAIDHPFVSLDSLKSLLVFGNERRFVVPAFSGRLGHPIIFPCSAVPYLQQFKNLRQLSKEVGRFVVDVDDAGIHYNINRREDLP